MIPDRTRLEGALADEFHVGLARLDSYRQGLILEAASTLEALIDGTHQTHELKEKSNG